MWAEPKSQNGPKRTDLTGLQNTKIMHDKNLFQLVVESP
jgi:hypothetical protein